MMKNKDVIFQHILGLKKHHQVFFSLLILLGVVLVWRGMLNLINKYWFPDQLLLSNVTGILIGVLILYGSHKITKMLAGE